MEVNIINQNPFRLKYETDSKEMEFKRFMPKYRMGDPAEQCAYFNCTMTTKKRFAQESMDLRTKSIPFGYQMFISMI